MKVSEREKKILVVWCVAVVLMLGYYFWPADDGVPPVVGASGSVADAEQQLERVRRLAAQVPAREQMLGRMKAEFEQWEAGIIQSETGQQGQAELLQIMREIGSSQVPPLEFSSVEIGQIRRLADSEDYGEALVSVSFDCAIEQLVNVLADMTARSEMLVTDELRISPTNNEDKILRVRMSVAGLVPGSQVPKHQGLGGF
jgi:type II secretion system (T2SS) protein M